jgi:DNA-binding transcriptional MerR regulator
MNDFVRYKETLDPTAGSVEPEAPAFPAEEGTADLSGAKIAKLRGVTLRALRFYESRGLISPRRVGRIRSYSQADNDRIGLILKAKKLGFTLTEIGQMIDGNASGPKSQGLQLTAQKCQQQINHLERQMKDIVEALADLRRMYLSLGVPQELGVNAETP